MSIQSGQQTKIKLTIVFCCLWVIVGAVAYSGYSKIAHLNHSTLYSALWTTEEYIAFFLLDSFLLLTLILWYKVFICFFFVFCFVFKTTHTEKQKY